MATAPVDHGQLNKVLLASTLLETRRLQVGDGTISKDDGIVQGEGTGTSSFIATAAGTTTAVTKARKGSSFMLAPVNAAAGLLLRTKTCSWSAAATGSNGFAELVFVVSATGAGAPAGTEAFTFIYMNDVT